MPIPSRLILGAALAFGLCDAAIAAPVQGYEVRKAYPHDTAAYTEGLFYLDGLLFESTGEVGSSDLRKVRLADGVVVQRRAVPGVFGEGIVNWGHEVISLTWRDQVGFRWDLKTFRRKSSFRYVGEGWALTQNGRNLIMSDGTPTLKFLDPVTLREVRRIRVTADGRAVDDLNELEWVKGEILANVWLTNRIARIDPQTGVVKAWIDLSGLPETLRTDDPDAVLNGIAYDAARDRLFVTGKMWAHLYEIGLKPPKDQP